MRVEVTVRAPDGERRVLPLRGQITIGRGPENDVVIPNLRVSWNHALVWDDGADVRVVDLDSRNGTALDGQWVKDPRPFPIGSRLQVADVELTVAATAGAESGAPPKRLAVEHVAAGVRYPLRSTHLAIGDHRDADLRIPGGEQVTVLCHPDGEVWIARGRDDEFLAEGELFEVSGVALRVVPADGQWTPVASDADATCPYDVVVSPADAAGPWAEIRCARTSRTCRLTAATRVALLQALAATRSVEHGWRSNTAVAVALWGPVGAQQDPRLLRDIVHHVRTEIRAAGLDPRCVEKRRGYLRLHVRDAIVV